MPILSILYVNNEYLAEIQAFRLLYFLRGICILFSVFDFGRTKIKLFIFRRALLSMLRFLTVFFQIFEVPYEENDDIYLCFVQSHTTGTLCILYLMCGG